MANTTTKKSAPRSVSFCITFLAVWLVVFAVPMLGMGRLIMDGDPTGWNMVTKSWLNLLSYFAVSAISEFLLIPLFLNRGRIAAFAISAVVLLGGFGAFEAVAIQSEHHHLPKPEMQEPVRRPKHPKGDNLRKPEHHKHGKKRFERPSMAVPIAAHTSIAMLIIGTGIGFNLMTRYRRERDRIRQLEKYRLEQELAGLRAQISPHFFMNILNNIHSMMDTDVAHAQDMVLKMSDMMRYVTYDSSMDSISLTREVAFIRDYISLMADRYPAERVTVDTDFPTQNSAETANIPPMVFITFIENAFKHGVTYRRHTTITTRLTLENSPRGKRIIFRCDNTVPDTATQPATDKAGNSGIGLTNVRRRLEMIYGDNFNLSAGLTDDGHLYSVTLNIPANENTLHGH